MNLKNRKIHPLPHCPMPDRLLIRSSGSVARVCYDPADPKFAPRITRTGELLFKLETGPKFPPITRQGGRVKRDTKFANICVTRPVVTFPRIRENSNSSFRYNSLPTYRSLKFPSDVVRTTSNGQVGVNH